MARSHDVRRRIFGLAIVAAALSFVAACGGASSSGASAQGVPHNKADVSFASEMIPHHQQAVEMADMALATSKNADITALATTIKGEQAPEIASMTGFLRDWQAPARGAGGHDMSAMGTGAMNGMMSNGEMTALGKATGPAFDKLWVDMMTRHHEGAVEMAKVERKDGQSEPAKALAQAIIVAQTAEITSLKALAARLG